MKHFVLSLLCLLTANIFAGQNDTTEKLEQLLETRQCQNCMLQGIDLSGMDLSGINLSGAGLSGNNLSDTALSGANLKQADLSDLDIDQVFEDVEIMGTQLEGARFKDGVVCGTAPTKGGWGCQQL